MFLCKTKSAPYSFQELQQKFYDLREDVKKQS